MSVIEEILDLYRRRGGATYGEGVTQSQHALQSAWLAEKSGAAKCAGAVVAKIQLAIAISDIHGMHINEGTSTIVQREVIVRVYVRSRCVPHTC